MGWLDKLKDRVGTSEDYVDGDLPQEFSEDYIELGTHTAGPKAKIMVRSFILEDFADIKPTLDALREGYTIALVNIGPLKERDPIELKRAVSKLKKTCEALEGDIAGFSDNWLVVTPGFASVYREARPELLREE